jgi:hypothetical protein
MRLCVLLFMLHGKEKEKKQRGNYDDSLTYLNGINKGLILAMEWDPLDPYNTPPFFGNAQPKSSESLSFSSPLSIPLQPPHIFQIDVLLLQMNIYSPYFYIVNFSHYQKRF